MYLAVLVIGALISATSAQNVCTSDFCKNGGVCVLVVGSPSCACATGFSGKTCETVELIPSTACENDPCLNGGSCIPNGVLFTCVCQAGFSGTVCQVSGSGAPVVTSAPVTSAPVSGSCPARKSNKDNVGCSPAEVVFMIEYARGDSYFDVDHEGDFIKRIIDYWQVNDQNMRIGVVTYHDTVAEVFHIDDYDNPDELKGNITLLARRLRPSGQNDLAKAMEFVRTTSFTNSRPNAEKIVIPFVHMMPSATKPGILAAAQKLKDDCITIIGLGITNSRGYNFGRPDTTPPDDVVDANTMRAMVTSPANSHYEQYRDYTDLENSARDFNDNNCS